MASANPFNVQRAVQALPRPHRSPSMGDAVRDDRQAACVAARAPGSSKQPTTWPAGLTSLELKVDESLEALKKVDESS